MRKAYTVSAIAVAASLAVAAPATAFAADGAPAPAPVTSTSTTPDQPQEAVQVRLSKTSGKPGDKITVTVKTEAKADKVSVSSDGLDNIQVAQASKAGDTWIATATIAKDAKFGTYQVNAIANFPDTAQQASATLSVNTDPIVKPDPTKPSLSLSTDGGKPGDKVGVTIKGKGAAASVESDAFGGKVALTKSGENTFHGTATVSKNTKSGYYRVDGFLDGSKIDSAKFGVANDATPAPKPTPVQPSLSLSTDGGKPGDKVGVTIKGSGTAASVESDAFGGKVSLVKSGENTFHGTATVSKNTKSGYYRVDGYLGNKKIDSVKFGVANDAKHTTNDKKTVPLNPTHHKTPRGSVNTGQAPAASSQDGVSTGMIAGAAGLGVAALTGAAVLRRRHNG
ncbi:hypothetical protein [Streptomyces sp. NBC_01465]|uniref:hypothetical protein n=1 Tax=Streptomyces sp. NBC_01465 TaxID=2903878 RepID=UPI002E2F3822|nr:hypothetical protein [Streptomyces sp. NBC_01465]